ncbi:uncharacterized protein LOC125666724 isoform X5 [Ostrea edulis]|uniref:uncharacterized protein LOC125666724 isoform X5 n=1 Tax=Ostrea edulis TaxID=37623 RepID=UPI0024AED225|nr:uncharacterized protein LOC125666724 isoform X5 [Ostrea edulis]
MSISMDFVKQIISRPRVLRSEPELEVLVDFFRKKSPLLQNLDKNILMDIGRNCTYHKCTRDDVIIKQGEKGDALKEEDEFNRDSMEIEFCFYIILNGSVSVYIDPKMTGEDEFGRWTPARNQKTPSPVPSSVSATPEPGQPPGLKGTVALETLAEEEEDESGEVNVQDSVRKQAQAKIEVLDRSKFGKLIVNYGAGKSFGEVALVKRDSFRNASVIADEDVDLLVIGQDLFDRSLKCDHEKEFAEISNFIESHPFFCHMPNKLKKLLEMSLRRETFIFDSVMVKQGDPVTGMHFILKGQANVTVEPHKHQKQYSHLWPFEAGVDIYAIEFEHLREARRQAILRKYEDPAVWETKSEELVIRRTEGYAAVEKRMKERHVDLCSIQDREILGDIEIYNNLSTYMHTVKCTANTEVFILDTKNYDRIVGKRNTATINIMREYVKAKLETRMNMKQGHLVPFLQFLHFKLTEESLPQSKPLPPLKTSKTLPDRDTMLQQLLQWFRDGKSTVVEPFTPGAVFYKELMKEKAAARKDHPAPVKTSVALTLRANRRNQPPRKPRSLMEIRESLRQMMEAEVIEFENEAAKKQIGSRKKPKDRGRKVRKRHSSQTQSNFEGSRSKAASLQSLASLPNYSGDKEQDESDNTLLKIFANHNKPPNENESKPKSRRGSLENASRDEQKSVKPVLITEVNSSPRKEQRVDLPNIKEERTQEEIILKKQNLGLNTKDNLTLNTEKSDVAARTQFQVPNAAKSKELQVSNLENVPTLIGEENTLPNIPGAETSSIVKKRNENSKWTTAMKFVNENIQRRLMTKKESDNDNLPHYDDYESNDKNLTFLENRLMAFHVKYGGKAKLHMKLPKLARYTTEENEVKAPKPGGKVWIRRRMCRFADNKIQVKDHQHVRHHIVGDIPDFDTTVQKQKRVMQAFL